MIIIEVRIDVCEVGDGAGRALLLLSCAVLVKIHLIADLFNFFVFFVYR